MKKILLSLVIGLIAGQASAQDRKVSAEGFVQAQYSYSSYDGETQKSAFELKRARIDLKGNLNDRLSFRFMSEMAVSPTLLDVSINYRFSKYASIMVGQFKNPFSLANQLFPMESCSTETLLPVSSYIGRPGNYSEGYDNGIMLSGSAIANSRGYDILHYNVAIMNGGPINSRNDDNTDKNITGRLDIKPISNELTLSVSGMRGNYSNVSNGGSRYSGLSRIGGGFQYDDSKLVLRSEIFSASTDNWTGFETTRIKSNSFYAQAYYWLPLGTEGRISPILSYDYIDKDIDQTHDELSNLVIGAEYWPFSYLRLLVNYRLTTDSSLTRYQHAFHAQAAITF